jgi:hypothetical protein
MTAGARSASALMHKSVTMVQTWRRIMKALIAALALATLIAAPTFAHSANATPMSPASSSFGPHLEFSLLPARDTSPDARN